jgi:3',5'-nucleoside bisphosphate phosphatase
MRTKKLFILTMILVLLSGQAVVAQNTVNNVKLYELNRQKHRTNINVPEIDGYKTLKCDFHMHTMFSDGIVWPTLRVAEAWYEGLDAISITEHLENNPSRPHIGGDDNSSYEIALPASKDYNILLVRGAEITRSMPPGHLNALFISDANKLDVKEPLDAIMEAHRQGAFITFNHPGWKAQQPDTCLLFDIHKELIEKDVIHAVEVFNENEWYPIALGWCIEHNLAVTGYSDIHEVSSHYYPLDKYHRPMTLVFATERSIEGLRDAMFARRTVAWFSKYVAGPDHLLQPLYHNSVTVSKLKNSDSKGRTLVEVRNNSDFTFELQPVNADFPGATLQPNSTELIRLDPVKAPARLQYTIANWFIDTGKNPTVTHQL